MSSLGILFIAEKTARVTAELDRLRERHSALVAEWEELMEQVEAVN